MENANVTIRRVAVFCSSNSGVDPIYQTAAASLGCALAANKIETVYGGTNVGLMLILAEAALSQGGVVTGVITKYLMSKGITHPGLTNLLVVDSMHQRKSTIAELADGFILMPGGHGSLEEFFEACTWTQLGIQHKPVAILNTKGYFNLLLQFLDLAVNERFIKPAHRKMISVSEDPLELLTALQVAPPVEDKWIKDTESC